MRTYQDAKVMAKSLRDSLAARGFSLSHSECLEITAQQFGFSDWNILSAKLTTRNSVSEKLFCSFCGKSQHDVQFLVEGGCKLPRHVQQNCVFICDQCVAVCEQAKADTTEVSKPGGTTGEEL
jgi:hypothetical protein